MYVFSSAIVLTILLFSGLSFAEETISDIRNGDTITFEKNLIEVEIDYLYGEEAVYLYGTEVELNRDGRISNSCFLVNIAILGFNRGSLRNGVEFTFVSKFILKNNRIRMLFISENRPFQFELECDITDSDLKKYGKIGSIELSVFENIYLNKLLYFELPGR